ncbi:uncharacterized protein LOC115759894 isoform X2 [Drosophila novamexicana]|uniref:uncharacterized protein LOC115759894 isoform X2 n=1 Tax=Drosophila novamexicana TaxID=47314 RepID=UPI0011E5B23E|nr:uncharacterized protein LOC115759894 isoform X2 [Drosophila novamexicana]
MKSQYLHWLHLQMEHYENKQIFINDKYKGCRSSSWRWSAEGQSQMEQHQHSRTKDALLTISVFAMGEAGLQLGHVNCRSSNSSSSSSQDEAENGNETGKSLIVDIIFLTALHLFLGCNLSTLLAVAVAIAFSVAFAFAFAIAESISILLPNNVFLPIDCVMLFIKPGRKRGAAAVAKYAQ